MDNETFLGGDRSLKNASVDIRKGFVRKVYGILSAQLVATVMIAAPIVKSSQDAEDIQAWMKGHSWLILVSSVGLVVAQCAMCCCTEALRTFPTNYIFLFLFTGAEALLVAYVSAMFTWQSVLLAAGITVGIFVAMTIYACTTESDFTGFGPYLVGALFALIIFGFTLSALSMLGVALNMAMMFYNLCGVILFTMFIVYDTQMILGEWGGHKQQFGVDDYCFAALNLYLDIIQLFLQLVELLGDRR